MYMGDAGTALPEEMRPAGAAFASRFRTTPRLMSADSTGRSTAAHTTVAQLAIPAERVQERAAVLVERARSSGRGHSMRLWRMALQTALQELTREASGTPASATCGAFSWEAHGETYKVMATFGQPPVVH